MDSYQVSFVIPSQLSALYPLQSIPGSHRTAVFRSTSKPHRFSACSQNVRPVRPSTAIHRTDIATEASARYIDLRTMTIVHANNAHFRTDPEPPPGFPMFKHIAALSDASSKERLFDSLFTADTVPLSETQRSVVHTLLSHHSTVLSVVAGDEKDAILLDLVMRNRVWKERIVYCAASRRTAESTFLSLCAQLGPERRNEVVLNLGDGSPCTIDSDTRPSSQTRVIITSPPVLKKSIANNESENDSWSASASVIFIDSLTDLNLSDWEETLLSLPSQALVCVLTRELGQADKDFLPLWLESIQNTVVSITPPGASSVLTRNEQPQNFPLLRTFAFNAALHKSPVQVSLALLKEVLLKDLENADEDVIPDYAESFLHGITMIPAEDPTNLFFESAEEAEFADIAALVVADAKRTEESMRSKSRRRTRTKRKERTPASRAAARRRRESAHADALLLPAIVLIRDHARVENAARSVRSALGTDAELLWDEDTKEHVEDIVTGFKSQFGDGLTDADVRALDLLMDGIGVVHNRCTPSIRIIVEELFRGGLVPVLIADTHLGSTDLCSLPSSKSVLVESDVLATCDDQGKGLIVASTPGSLAGRLGKDDVGNLIMMWYHESIDDETAAYEIASNLLLPILAPKPSEANSERVRSYKATGYTLDESFDENESVQTRRGMQTLLSTTYDSILRSLRRFGNDGYESIAEYSLKSFKQWAKRGALHATLEKFSVEKKAIDESFDENDWESIAEYSRRIAKVNEVERVFKAMTKKYEAVRNRRILEELRASRPGRMIGIRRDGKQLPVGEQGTSESSESEENVPETNEMSTESEKLTNFESGAKKLITGVFVCVFDQESEGSGLNDDGYRYLAVCVLADGVWTMVPVTEVEALADGNDIISNVDLLMMPHPATFDVDPETTWAKCAPIDASEQNALHRVSDELIARMASETRPNLGNVAVGEFESQRKLVEQAKEHLRQSQWFGREDEMNELRRLRRRSAELTDEIKTLRLRKDHFELELMQKHNDIRSIQSALIAVLEDCHAVSFVGGKATEMTPIGALASVLPCKFPVFSGACLSLIDDMETLPVPSFAAFVALVVCEGRSLADATGSNREGSSADQSDLYEPLDLSHISKSRPDNENESLNMDNSIDADLRNGKTTKAGLNGSESDENEEVGTNRSMASTFLSSINSDKTAGSVEVLPSDIRSSIVEIQEALYQLHRRHLDECQPAKNAAISEIVPQVLNTRLSDAIYQFAIGASWQTVVDSLGKDTISSNHHSSSSNVTGPRSNPSSTSETTTTSGHFSGYFGTSTQQIGASYLVTEIRRVCAVLHVICEDDICGEFSTRTREIAREALTALSRWPVHDVEVMRGLLDSGVVERHWAGNTYDKWWRSVRDDLTRMCDETSASSTASTVADNTQRDNNSSHMETAAGAKEEG